MSSRDRRIVSQNSLERENSKGDDPWCLTCGANLALEGRTYTIVQRHINGELCDIFSRVLGAEFSPDYASINVCNRCERQLRRLGRYNSIVLARHEAEKLREQLERNLAKYGQKVIESGRVEDLPSPSSDTAFVKSDISDIVHSSTGGGKGQIYEGHSSIRKIGKLSSRSVSSVHFEDDVEFGRKEAANRKFSAPAGSVKKRDSISSFSETARRRENRRRKWSSASSTSEENQPLSPSTTSPRKLSLIGRNVALNSYHYRDASRFHHKSIPIDQQTIPNELTTDYSREPEEPLESPEDHQSSDMSTSDEKIESPEDKSEPKQQSGNDEKPKTRRRSFLARFMPRKSLESQKSAEEAPEEVKENSEHDKNSDAKVSSETDEISCVKENSETGEKIDVKESSENYENPDAKTNSELQKEDGPEGEQVEIHYKDSETNAVWAGRINPFNKEREAGQTEDNVNRNESTDDDVFVSGVGDEKPLPRMDSLQPEDELFPKEDTDPFKEDSAQDSDSSNEGEMDPSDFNADNHSVLSEVEERITTKTKFKGAYYNIGSTEDLLQEFANEQDREKAMWSQLTFTESIDLGDGCMDSPVRPPRRRSGKSSQKKPKRKGRKLPEEGTREENEDKENDSNIAEEAAENSVDETGTHQVGNGVEPTVSLNDEDGKSQVTFAKDGTDQQAGQARTDSMIKSEKSPLISKDGGDSTLKLKNGNESRVKDQMPGFLCCSIL